MKKRHILFLILAMVLALGVFVSAQASVTTAESGPAIGKHQPQAYAIDTDTGIVTNLTTGEQVSEKKTNEMPVLYGGDTLEFHYGANKLYYVFVDSKGDFTPSPPPGADGQTRVKVLGTAKVAWGDVTLNVLTKIEILGDDIVQLNEGLFTSGGGINLFVLKHAYGPRWCNINSELWFIKNSDHHQLSAAESASAAYYTNEGSTTRTWAEDCLLNGYSATHKDVLLTLRRPYIEGLFFTGVGFDSKTGKNQISKEYRIEEGNGWHGNSWEGWQDNQIEIYTSPYCQVVNR